MTADQPCSACPFAGCDGCRFDAANTYIDKTGHRNCRACRAARERERRAAHGK